MDITIQDLQRMAAERFPFDREHYPNLPTDESNAASFAQMHILLHLGKNLGEIAAVLEPKDHGVSGTQVSPQVIRKLLVNAIRLADVSGVSMQDIQTSLDNWSKGLER